MRSNWSGSDGFSAASHRVCRALLQTRVRAPRSAHHRPKAFGSRQRGGARRCRWLAGRRTIMAVTQEDKGLPSAMTAVGPVMEPAIEAAAGIAVVVLTI